MKNIIALSDDILIEIYNQFRETNKVDTSFLRTDRFSSADYSTKMAIKYLRDCELIECKLLLDFDSPEFFNYLVITNITWTGLLRVEEDLLINYLGGE